MKMKKTTDRTSQNRARPSGGLYIFLVFPRSLCLFLVLSAVFSLPVFSLPQEPAGNGTNSGNELSRLIGISTRLSELNETLRNELEDSRKSSAELLNTLGKSKEELDGLRNELESLRVTSTELLNRAETSSRESAELREALRKAEISLASLEQSFGAYRIAAEARIESLDRSRRFLKTACIAAAAFALGGWVAFGIAVN
ncbi:hypothetical protein [Breznakiella homolactica]|uniref:Uncharacterized protein n=1 Tax=Breznakiella homolactica TaxID=2798577 RepID=A0A7T8BAB5_9SPIR|nr:hypothetical protein [Breznakiella homolactica]QQO09201.1 hypothetical protein JFL75_20095 [Breznakiella homolactica]